MDLAKIKEKYPEKAIGRAEDLTNQHFGKWTVLYRTLNDCRNKTMWVCQCDCDNHTIKPVTAKSLKDGTSTSCGCSRLETIQKKSQNFRIKNEKGNVIQKRCYSCKQMLPITEFWKNSAMIDGYSNKCKKCNSYDLKENKYNYYKKNAKRRNYSFELSKEQFYNLISQPCYYCGENLQSSRGIDRVDSKKGYFLENCVPCCEVCNRMKLDYPVDFWINHMKTILLYYGDNNE